MMMKSKPTHWKKEIYRESVVMTRPIYGYIRRYGIKLYTIIQKFGTSPSFTTLFFFLFLSF